MDVSEEEHRVSENCLDPIIVKTLSKKYPHGFKAIKNISFGVNAGEIFGLLGPNGAGKSTTFNIATGMLKPSLGSVRLLNQSVEEGRNELFQQVGICPQFDCLWDNLTVKEHLMLFGRLKGLNSDDLNSSINYLMNSMQLIEFSKIKCKNLSGGNKRKVCVCNALIGNSSLVFLDEPSNGLDPIARRYLWRTLVEISKKKNISVVLTTHSLSESEFVCNKLGTFVFFLSAELLINRDFNQWGIRMFWKFAKFERKIWWSL